MMEKGKICVSIAGADAEAVYAGVQPVLEKVDVVEVRLDFMEEPDVVRCCEFFRKPLLFTNRPIWEGGEFSRFEDERVRPLFAAVESQAAYVDFELRADPQLRSQLLEAMESSSTRMILSWHDFKSTPTPKELAGILQQMMDSGAHIGKIVTTANTQEEVLRVLHLQERALAAGFPLSCFCMGEAGRISRLATLYLGGYMTYGALSDARATASGQLSIERLYGLCREFEKGSDDG